MFEVDGAAAAGDVITYINYKGDILSFSVDVYVNPLVLMGDGRHKINLNYPVEDSIKTYLKNLPFNGEFDVQKFEAAILATEGVLKLKTNKVESKWIVAQGGDADGYGLFQPISVYKILKDGNIELVEQQSTLGKGPRDFAIDPTGNFLLVGHQYTNDIVIFKRDITTGKITDTGKRIQLCSPVGLVFTKI